jgi:hypothetical protein
MSIQDDFNKIKPKGGENGSNREVPDIETVSFNDSGEIESNSIIRKFFLISVIVLVSVLSFGLGRLSGNDQKKGIEIRLDETYSTSTSSYIGNKEEVTKSIPKVEAGTSSVVVGSIKGTKYHYLYCPGAKQIAEANKVTFANPAAAEMAGYTLALNCKPR